MHAVVVSLTVHDREAAVTELHNQVVPTESGAPGFVASYWIALPNGQGRGTIVFDSEAVAQAAAGQIQRREAVTAVTIDGVQVGEVVAHA